MLTAHKEKTTGFEAKNDLLGVTLQHPAPIPLLERPPHAKEPKLYRMLRVLEYIGTREQIDDAIKRRGVKGTSPRPWGRSQLTITEAFIGEIPTALSATDLHNTPPVVERE